VHLVGLYYSGLTNVRQYFAKNSHCKFRENPMNILVTDTSPRTDGQTDGRGVHIKMLFFISQEMPKNVSAKLTKEKIAVVFFLLCDSPASELCVPTFRNTLSVTFL